MAKETVHMENEEVTIDLLELFLALKKKAIWIIAVMLLGALLAGGISEFCVLPTYTAEATLYVFDQSTNITSLNDLQMGTQLAKDFTILATSEPVVNKVIEEIGLETTYEELVKKITAENTDDTRLIVLTVEDHNAQKAQQITNALAEALVDRVTEIMETSRACVAVPASEPQNPSGPNVKRNAILGALVGFLLVAGIVTIKYITDDTIKNSDDVEKFLGLVTLAEIPLDYSADGKNGRKRRHKRKSKNKSKKKSKYFL